MLQTIIGQIWGVLSLALWPFNVRAKGTLARLGPGAVCLP
jgi:hypothetical protein